VSTVEAGEDDDCGESKDGQDAGLVSAGEGRALGGQVVLLVHHRQQVHHPPHVAAHHRKPATNTPGHH